MATKHRAARRPSAERLVAVDSAYLLVFILIVVLAVLFPEAAAALCGIGGITGRAAGREAARLTARLWDRTHRPA